MVARTHLGLVRLASTLSMQRRNFTMELTPGQRELQQACREFAENTLAPNAAQVDREARFPYTQIKKLSELGLMRMCVSPERGGAGRDMLSLALAVEELARGCASTAFVYCIHNALFANLVEQRGTEEQKAEFLEDVPTECVGGFALSESGAGSDVAAIQTLVKDDGDDFIISGEKAWVTSAIEGRALAVFASADPTLKHKGLACFLVPLDTPGVFRGQKQPTFGVRGASVCSVTLQDVRLPRRYLVGSVGEGFRIAMQQLDQVRVGIAAKAVGVAQAALDLALNHSSERTAFGRPLLRHHHVQDRLTDMCILIESARLLTWRAAAHISTKNSAMAKYVAARSATAVAEHAMQVLGAKGLSTVEAAERLYRDARGTQIYGGVTDVQKKLVGFHLIGEIGPFWCKKD